MHKICKVKRHILPVESCEPRTGASLEPGPGSLAVPARRAATGAGVSKEIAGESENPLNFVENQQKKRMP